MRATHFTRTPATGIAPDAAAGLGDTLIDSHSRVGFGGRQLYF